MVAVAVVQQTSMRELLTKSSPVVAVAVLGWLAETAMAQRVLMVPGRQRVVLEAPEALEVQAVLVMIHPITWLAALPEETGMVGWVVEAVTAGEP